MINNTIQPNLVGLGADGLSNINPTSEVEIQRYAKEFEGIFLSMLAKEMRKTVGEGGLLNSESTDSLGGMFDMYIGQALAESQPLGISNLWLNQYKQNAAAANGDG